MGRFDIDLYNIFLNNAENDNFLQFNFIGEFCSKNTARVNDANSAFVGMLDNQYNITCDAFSADLTALQDLLLPRPKLLQLFGNYNAAL